jgi:hypothetical protein
MDRRFLISAEDLSGFENLTGLVACYLALIVVLLFSTDIPSLRDSGSMMFIFSINVESLRDFDLHLSGINPVRDLIFIENIATKIHWSPLGRIYLKKYFHAKPFLQQPNRVKGFC